MNSRSFGSLITWCYFSLLRPLALFLGAYAGASFSPGGAWRLLSAAYIA
jgi:hypothetical protein